MEVHFTPEEEAQLSRLAECSGTDAERLVKQAALELLEDGERFRAAVRRGIAEADRGEFVAEEEMNRRVHKDATPLIHAGPMDPVRGGPS